MSKHAVLAVAAATAIALASVVDVGTASADDLTSIYGQILDNPVSVELNLQYAMIAEGRGEYRKALSAYERILANDPGNEAARRGLQRIRRIIEPPITQTTWEGGGKIESNPLREPSPVAGDIFGYGSVRVRDERPLGAYRWRTLLGAYGELHSRETQMNYGNLSAETGPLIDLGGSMLTFRPAAGGAIAAFDGRFYYWDLNASGTLEGYLQGAHQWVRLRTGYRQYDPSFTSDDGFYADLTGRFSRNDIFHDGDVVSVSPWLRWSGIAGEPNGGADEFSPGRYIDYGATVEYAKIINEWLTASASFKVGDRLYADIGGGARRDLTLSPGASLIFTNLLGIQTDLRFDYRYEWNDSNDDDHDWQNHSLKIGVVVRR